MATTQESAPVVKCIVVGDAAVGKSYLLRTYRDNKFPSEWVPTVLDNFPLQAFWDGKVVALNVWDTTGYTDYDRLRPLCYPDTDVFIICFSLDDPYSLENVRLKWHREVRNHCPQVPIILVGTKADLRSDDKNLRNQPFVTYQQGWAMADQIGATNYVECSSLLNERVKDVFEEVVESVCSQWGQKRDKNKAIALHNRNYTKRKLRESCTIS